MPQGQVANTSVFDFGAPSGPKLGTAATATATLSTVVDTNTVTLSDGINTVIFEFESVGGVTGTNTEVLIGGSDTAAAAALAAAITASVLRMTAVGAAAVCTITATTDEGSEVLGNDYTATRVGAPVTIVDFGAVVVGVSQAAGAAVLEFRAKAGRGGKLRMNFESSNADANYEVTVQLAASRPDILETPSLYANSSVAANGAAVVDLVVVARTQRDATVFVRPNVDEFIRVVASGAARGVMTMTGDQGLDIVRI